MNKRVETTWAVLTWMAGHSCMMLNGYQVGKDGKTPHRRATGKDCMQKTLEFGEQVYAKPKRRPSTNRKQALETRWKLGTWVGMTNRSNEHIVIVHENDTEYAIRVRTVRRVSADHRWSADAIQKITATVKIPIPAQRHRGEPLVAEAREARHFAEVGGDGTKLAEAEVEKKDKLSRDLKITKRILDKYGLTAGCPRCEASLMGKSRIHNHACRSRIEEEMQNDGGDQETINKRNERVPMKNIREPEEKQKEGGAASSNNQYLLRNYECIHRQRKVLCSDRW